LRRCQRDHQRNYQSDQLAAIWEIEITISLVDLSRCLGGHKLGGHKLGGHKNDCNTKTLAIMFTFVPNGSKKRAGVASRLRWSQFAIRHARPL
jgi:hypothetical protein